MNYTMNSDMKSDLEALFDAAKLPTLDRQIVKKKIEGHYEEVYGLSPTNRDEFFIHVTREWIGSVHQASADAGWWDYDEEFDNYLEIIKSNKLALIHSELSGVLEGVRKGCQDKHLPKRMTEEVKLAETVIRIFDYCGKYGIDLPGIMIEKLAYKTGDRIGRGCD